MLAAFASMVLVLIAPEPVDASPSHTFDAEMTAAGLTICPDAVRSGGASLEDRAALEAKGFARIDDGKSDARAALGKSRVLVIYSAKSKNCGISTFGTSVEASFENWWRKLAAKQWPNVRLDEVLSEPNWVSKPALFSSDGPEIFVMLEHRKQGNGSRGSFLIRYFPHPKD